MVEKMNFEIYFNSVIKDFAFPNNCAESIFEHLKSEVSEIEEEIRDFGTEGNKNFEDEVGDAFACLCFLMHECGLDPNRVMHRNWMKLEDRALNGKS